MTGVTLHLRLMWREQTSHSLSAIQAYGINLHYTRLFIVVVSIHLSRVNNFLHIGFAQSYQVYS